MMMRPIALFSRGIFASTRAHTTFLSLYPLASAVVPPVASLSSLSSSQKCIFKTQFTLPNTRSYSVAPTDSSNIILKKDLENMIKQEKKDYVLIDVREPSGNIKT
jgi:hypothetical protein